MDGLIEIVSVMSEVNGLEEESFVDLFRTIFLQTNFVDLFETIFLWTSFE